MRQCVPDGEINVPLRDGLISEADVAGEIGKVICGELEGRQSADQVTVFDSTGIALQDSATVPLEHAPGLGTHDPLVASSRGHARFSVLLDGQRWHAAFHLRQLEHVTGARLLPSLGALALPTDVF